MSHPESLDNTWGGARTSRGKSKLLAYICSVGWIPNTPHDVDKGACVVWSIYAHKVQMFTTGQFGHTVHYDSIQARVPICYEVILISRESLLDST